MISTLPSENDLHFNGGTRINYLAMNWHNMDTNKNKIRNYSEMIYDVICIRRVGFLQPDRWNNVP